MNGKDQNSPLRNEKSRQSPVSSSRDVLREKLCQIRDRNPWARNLAQCLDETTKRPEEAPHVARAMKLNAFFLEHGDKPVPTLPPDEIARRLHLGEHPRDHQ